MAIGALSTVTDQLRSRVLSVYQNIRRRLLGANNERLDLLMDTFYKLAPAQRAMVIVGVVGVVSIVVLGFVGFYFAQVSLLNNELNKRFEALNELRDLKIGFQQETARFTALSDLIDRKTRALRIKPYFEKIANDQNVQVEGLTEQRTAITGDNPLGEKLQEVKVEMRLNNISIPRLLNFLVEVEKGGNFLRIQDLQIQGRYGTKLYFDAKLKVHGYVPIQ